MATRTESPLKQFFPCGQVINIKRLSMELATTLPSNNENPVCGRHVLQFLRNNAIEIFIGIIFVRPCNSCRTGCASTRKTETKGK